MQALPDSVDKTQQEALAQNGYSESQIAAYAAAGGLPYLDNTDTVFGQVFAGMDVVDAIAMVAVDENDKPADDVIIESITFENYEG